MRVTSVLTLLYFLMCLSTPVSAIGLYGTTDMHDPSTIVNEDGTYWTFGTGGGASNFPINALYSNDLVNWSRGPSPIPANTYPNWINSKVPGFDGNFWAPDLIEMNGRYYLYYSAFSSTSGMNSAIGVLVTDSLNNPNWQDLGMLVSTQDEPNSGGQPVNAIDAGVFRDASGNVWIVYGSHYAGIYMRQLNPSSGLLMNGSRYPVVGNNENWHEYEAAQVQYIDGYYYMFVNLGECCAGNQSTYYIVVGRSSSPTGPYLDKNGVSLWNYGGSTVLSTDGNYIGPGHFGYLNNNGQNLASIHYYDGTTSNGWPGRLDILEMNMVSGWPTFTRNFSLNNGSTPTAEPTVEPSPALLDDGRVSLISVHSGKALEVEAASAEDGANIIQWTYLGNDNQLWDIEHLGQGYYSIRAAHSGSSMDVYAWSTEDGGEIRQWSYLGGENQQWQFIDEGNGNYGILSRHSGKALDVFEYSTEDGGDILQWSYWAGAPQLWNLQYVNSTQPTPQPTAEPTVEPSAEPTVEPTSEPDLDVWTIVVEENAVGFCSVDGAVESDHAGYSGSGYANTSNANGNGVVWSVYAAQTGSYQLSWRYANGSSSRPALVMVNGATQVNAIDFAGTGAWQNYADSASVSVNLTAGNNTLRLQASGDAGLGNIDNLSLTGAEPAAAVCTN